jgi:hypothetical protein
MADELSEPKGLQVRMFLRGQAIYAAHVIGLIMPGQTMPAVNAHQIEPAPLDEWENDDLNQMIEEGRRQLDRQLSDLDRLRDRAQWLFTIGAGITAVLAGALAAENPSGLTLVLWLIGLFLLVYGVAGVAALMTVRADFAAIDTAVLSRSPRPISKSLATYYSRMLAVGENTLATRITVFWQAVLFVIVGGYVGLAAFLLQQ